MTSLNRLAFIGNSLPRRCGIATFTTDLRDAITHASPHIETAIIAMTDHGRTYDYPSSVRFQIRDNHLQDYIDTASALNAGRFDVVSLQHEFGIFGGEAGSHLMALLSRLNLPVVTTFHTVLAEPSRAQRDVMARVTEASSRVVVMANKAKDLLQAVYRVRPDKIEVIPHGIPDVPLVGSAVAKAKLGFTGRSVILTFGLLSPNKGIEVMIDAMPSIVARHPDTTYVVLGATHPNLVREQGETYRQTLIARTRERGVEHNVCFLDQFVGQAILLDFISSCDVYVTPYLNEAQMTSGTLAYSFGCGRPVVSTPYWHAQELLKDGQGVLVPFGNSNAIGEAMDDLLRDDRRRSAMGQNAYAASRTMTWLSTADRYLDAFTSATRGQRVSVLPRTVPKVSSQSTRALPPLQTGHFLSMCDDTGLFQHAVHAVPDRSHGYCIDDNARALLLSCALNSSPETRLPVDVSSRFNSFIQHAWNRGLGRFRNFMSFDRRWLEEQGSEDSHGRTLWAVGECSRSGGSDAERAWAKRLFAEAVPAALSFKSPRSWAFSLLGLNAYCEITPDDRNSDQVRLILADRLVSQFMAAATVDWPWFETGLAYDNARLSQSPSGIIPYFDKVF